MSIATLDLRPSVSAPDRAGEPLYFARPSAQVEVLRGEIDQAIARFLDGQTFILGDEVRAFEAEFAAFTGSAHAVGVANGTDAIHLALRALGIGAGHEVITTAHTAVATVAAIEMAGAVARFVDIDPMTYGLDPSLIEAAITSRTRAILPVHLYGHPVDMGPILEIAQRYGLEIIEDCAQAHGAVWQGRQVGTIGRIGCYSLYPTKNLGGLGDGGIVVTDDPGLAERLRMLRQYGWRTPQMSEMPGFNSRLDEMQAAILRVKLRHLAANNARRRAIADRYNNAFADLPMFRPLVADGCESVYHLYVLRLRRRDLLKSWLAERNIHAGIHYAMPVHRQPGYVDRYGDAHLPITESAADHVLSLPMYPELQPGQIDRVIDSVRAHHWAEAAD